MLNTRPSRHSFRLLTLRLAAFGAALLCSAVPAFAQMCLGNGSFAGAPIQLGGNVGVNSSVKAAAATLTVGANALFVGGSIGRESVDGVTGTIVNVAATIGSDIGSDRVHVCPVAGVFRTTGEHFGAFDTTNDGYTVGGSIGIVAAKGVSASAIPFFGISAVHNRVSVLDTPFVQSSSFGVATIGVGFVFHDRVAISPHVAMPFSVGDLNEPATFVLSLAINF